LRGVSLRLVCLGPRFERGGGGLRLDARDGGRLVCESFPVAVKLIEADDE
jgi:hypothetical protein